MNRLLSESKRFFSHISEYFIVCTLTRDQTVYFMSFLMDFATRWQAVGSSHVHSQGRPQVSDAAVSFPVCAAALQKMHLCLLFFIGFFFTSFG